MNTPVEGPFDEKPSVLPTYTNEGCIHTGRWEAAGDGKWYAFYANMGPGGSYNLEDERSPHWWHNGRDERRACRHGWWENRCPVPERGCGSGPDDWAVPALVLESAVEQTRNLLEQLEHRNG